ncbi:hypothetical protein [Streptomyces longispororuber]|uniref:hypothetical protein n=1 Tax=Streptomyces longispororuber TaxID=68230 RepID=UPI00210866E9|nr:hypothetical protein [Streptomyces longispororuber]MCQ4205730.1 hypothetical protein [Streptomyces longispororuber]
MTSTLVIGTAVTALSAVTGCAGNTRTTAQHAAARPAGDLPRDLTRAEQGRLEQAEELLIQRCMQHKGFRYQVPARIDADTDHAFTYRLVQDDVAWAREHGYGEQLRRAFFKAKEREEIAARRQHMTSAEHERFTSALQGGPDTPTLSARLPAGGTVRTLNGGCTRAARDDLYGDAKAWFHADKIATNLTAVYLPKVMSDPRFTAALKMWSRCMQDMTGHRYPDPDTARADTRQRTAKLGAVQAHTLEVEVAVAEATCARTTSLPATLSRLDREYGAPVREQYAEEIAACNRMKLAALQRADLLEDRD